MSDNVRPQPLRGNKTTFLQISAGAELSPQNLPKSVSLPLAVGDYLQIVFVTLNLI